MTLYYTLRKIIIEPLNIGYTKQNILQIQKI